jgi:acyl-CoA dehydrogenase family protein 9
MGDIGLSDPIGSIGVLADYVAGRVQRELRPDRVTRAHDSLNDLAEPITDQVKRLRSVSEGALRRHRKDIIERQFVQKRLADAVADVYAQIATLSRITAILDEQGADVSGQERYIAETFCRRASMRVMSNLDQVEHNDDERMTAIAKLALKRRAYGYSLD